MSILIVILILLLPAIITYVILKKKANKKENLLNDEIDGLSNKLERYSKISNLEDEENKISDNIESMGHLEKEKISSIEDLDSQYNDSLSKLDALNRSIDGKQLELKLLLKDISSEKELVEDYGFETFVFEFDDSEKYKTEIKYQRNYQRSLIKDDMACNTLFELTFNNSTAKGAKVQTRAKKMLIRTFNGEVDYIIKRLTFRNIDTSKNRINKSFESLNKLNDKSNGVVISDLYLSSKLRELDLHYGKKVREEEEKERNREERELLREEKAAKREIQNELRRQEKERKKKEKEIKLKEEIIKQITEELGLESEAAHKAKAEIEKLKQELQEVLGREKSISQAEITSAGYVYILSNIGSFGEDIYKIGLTRRLEPYQRVNELSSASVPFKYNCHGMIWSLNAVELESELHNTFDKYRVNKVNKRKEFFKIPFLKIKETINKSYPDVELIEDVEAEEYYQTLAIEKRNETPISYQN